MGTKHNEATIHPVDILFIFRPQIYNQLQNIEHPRLGVKHELYCNLHRSVKFP